MCVQVGVCIRVQWHPPPAWCGADGRVYLMLFSSGVRLTTKQKIDEAIAGTPLALTGKKKKDQQYCLKALAPFCSRNALCAFYDAKANGLLPRLGVHVQVRRVPVVAGASRHVSAAIQPTRHSHSHTHSHIHSLRGVMLLPQAPTHGSLEAMLEWMDKQDPPIPVQSCAIGAVNVSDIKKLGVRDRVWSTHCAGGWADE